MTAKPRLLAIAADWGRTDAERRHRASLLAALRERGLAAEALVLGTDAFEPNSLSNWAGLKGQQAQLDDPHALVGQTTAMRAVVGRARPDFVWGLDGAGNQASRVAQALDRTITRIVTATPASPQGGGLKRKLAELMGRDPNLTVSRTGPMAARDTLDLPPGLDLGQLRRHSAESVTRVLLRRAGIGASDLLVAGMATTTAGTDRIVSLDAALRGFDLAPIWLWLGVGEPPAGLRVVPSDPDVGGDLPLLAAVRAAVVADADALSRLTAREAVALGRPALVPSGSPDLDSTSGALPLPHDAKTTAEAVCDLTEDADRTAAAWSRAKAEWTVAQEAERLAQTLLPTG